MGNWAHQFEDSVPQDIPGMIAQLRSRLPYSSAPQDSEVLGLLAARATEVFRTVYFEVQRHETHNWWTDQLAKIGFYTDKRVSFLNNLIANIALAKAEGVYTLSAYFDPARAEGYLGPDLPGYLPLPDFSPEAITPSSDRLQQSLREILTSPNFETQNQKVGLYAPILAGFLMRDPSVPADVREFAQTLFSDKFQHAVYKKLGTVYDPNSMNRFYTDSFKAFHKMNSYRYIFDLVNGLTSVLVREKVGTASYFKRVFFGSWKAYEYKNLTDRDIQHALSTVLRAGENRIRAMHHEEPDDLTAVSIRESLEVMLGWNADYTKFERWKKYWDEWETMGGGWKCLCFIRRTIFNPYTVRQF